MSIVLSATEIQRIRISSIRISERICAKWRILTAQPIHAVVYAGQEVGRVRHRLRCGRFAQPAVTGLLARVVRQPGQERIFPYLQLRNFDFFCVSEYRNDFANLHVTGFPVVASGGVPAPTAGCTV